MSMNSRSRPSEKENTWELGGEQGREQGRVGWGLRSQEAELEEGAVGTGLGARVRERARTARGAGFETESCFFHLLI